LCYTYSVSVVYTCVCIDLQDSNGLLHSVKSEDSDLTCFEHPMSLAFPSNSSQAVVSQHSELLPHDSVIPDDFLDAESHNVVPQSVHTLQLTMCILSSLLTTSLAYN